MILRLLIITLAVTYLTACQTTKPTWYEQRCIQSGFKPGTTAFEVCTERDRKWIDHQRGGGP